MWNDTVRRQTESSFIAADVNNTPTLNRGTRVYSSDMLALQTKNVPFIFSLFIISCFGEPFSY